MSETIVMGSGLAGLLAAQYLVDDGQGSVKIIEPTDKLTASNAPLAICHPFPGRSLQPSPLLKEAYRASKRWMQRWSSWDALLVRELEMFRPFNSLGGDRLRASYEQHWHSGRNEWFDISMLEDGSGLVYGPCFGVKLGQLRTQWKTRLKKQGVVFTTAGPTPDWNGNLVLCPGRGITEWLPKLPIAREGGELVSFSTEQDLDRLISGGGVHMGPSGPRSVVGGSTRWTGQPPSPNSQLEGLQKQLTTLWPGIRKAEDIWQGMRAIHQTDRLPLAGPIPSRPKTWLIGSLGSKGLLWGPLAARSTIAHLLRDEPVPAGISTDRVSRTRWDLCWPGQEA